MSKGGTAGFINITGMAVAMLVAMEMQISQFTQVSSNVIMHIQYPETRGFDLIHEDKRFTLGWGTPRFWWGLLLHYEDLVPQPQCFGASIIN